VVPFVLVGVGLREVCDRAVEAVALAQVAGDLYPVSRTGVRPRKRLTAQAGVDDQLVCRHGLDFRRALHILELAPVEVASLSTPKPAEEDVARGLHQPLTRHDAVPMVLVGVRPDVGRL
jgi:hypothetical protein